MGKLVYLIPIINRDNKGGYEKDFFSFGHK
jgi:hypothetical protein